MVFLVFVRIFGGTIHIFKNVILSDTAQNRTHIFRRNNCGALYNH